MSDPPGSWERCTIDEYAADLVDLCDACGLDEPVVIGHSLGGDR
jgi:pimeloyl-ACP methyl ester carboxylesterase